MAGEGQVDYVKRWCGTCEVLTFGQPANLEGLVNTCPNARHEKGAFKTSCREWEPKEGLPVPKTKKTK